jgi:DNA-binding NtrC family response regulator
LPVDLILANIKALPGPVAEVLPALRKLPDSPSVVLLTDDECAEARAAALSAGALAVLHLLLPDEALGPALGSLIARRREEGQRQRRLDSVERPSVLTDFVTHSAVMEQLMKTARRVAEADTSLLLLGETGVGKERVAKAIHAQSRRASGPFIAVNCAAIPETLFESELFGHERGAFTGAFRARRGHFELAHHGTLFLDEVGDMPLATQVRLLRVLQEHCIQPVGSEESISIDVRIMAATNRDLKEEIAAKRFREDLYYRLSVVTLLVPTLRDRREDILALAEHYRAHFAERLSRHVVAISPEAQDLLIRHNWPGNVRELINVMENSVLLCQSDTIRPSDLPNLAQREWKARVGEAAASQGLRLDTDDWGRLSWRQVKSAVLRAAEREYLERLLRQHAGRVGVSAHQAGLSPRSLLRMMRQSGVDKAPYRQPGALPTPTAVAVP